MTVIVRAYAKINLGLEVLRRRPDGYHDIVTILHGIDLHDTIAADEHTDLIVESPDVGCEPQHNLVLRAAMLLGGRAAGAPGARIRLAKRIPMAAGLGGGSSDAAATLAALNRLWGLALSPGELADLGAPLGADVPFFFHLPSALATGRGELLERLPPLPALWAVVATPPDRIHSKTRTLYQALTAADFTDGAATMGLADALRRGRSLDPARMTNAFEGAARHLFPGLAGCEAAMLRAGAPFVRLSGSGPSLFTLVADEETASRLTGSLLAAGWPCLTARLLSEPCPA